MIRLDEIAKDLKEAGKYWISFAGDSVTSCEWVHPNWRDIVIYVLQGEMTDFLNGDWKTSEWGIKGFNFGYDGATTRDILEKVGKIKIVNPDLVVGMMGGNDPVLGVGVDESIENIRKIVERLDTSVVWCSTVYSGSEKKNKEYTPYSEAFLKILDDKNFQKVDLFNLYKHFPLKRIFTFISEENPIEGLEKGDPDLLHPNQLGNAYVAKVILKEVFNIDFDPELYIKTTLSGDKYPRY